MHTNAPRPPLVLVVDDDRLSREIIAGALDGLSIRIEQAASVEAARAILRSHRVDVVVADQVLPGQSGLSFLSALRDLDAEPRRILVTGEADLGTAVAAINQAEVFRFLVKPIDRVALRLAVFLAVESLERERTDRAALAAVRSSPMLAALVGAETARRAAGAAA